ncbi:MAG: acetolactate decarboxylase [Bacteroidales bacterium]|nr:acetolactate decarboxylase [Bacteroidales bacterium]
MNSRRLIPLFSSLLIVAAGCVDKNSDGTQDRDSLYQVSTLQALTASDYYGSVTIDKFLNHGDFGIGTFEGMEGEMIVLDGVCYQALADGSVAVPKTTDKIPFAAVSWFDKDIEIEFNSEYTFESLKTELNRIVASEGANTFYLMRLEGDFPEMKVRSISRQQEPYETLDKVVETSQMVFDYKNVKGTLIALYFPEYASGVNAAGWHMHFLSNEKDKGGHILGFTMAKGKMALDRTDSFQMILPDTDYFNNLDLTGQDEAIGKVELGK